NPIAVAGDLVRDIPEGIDMALQPGRTPLPGSPPLPSADTTPPETLAGTTPPDTLADSTPPATTPDTTTLAATTTVTNDDAVNVETKKTKARDGKPLTRLSLFATPGGGAATNGAQSSNRPIRDALKNFHPVRDVV